MKKHGKGKRQMLDGGDTSTGGTRSDDPPQLEEQSAGHQQIRSSTATEVAAARSIYVVVNTFDTPPVYSLYKVDYPYHSCSPTPKRRRLHRLATLETTGGKTFVSVQTRRRKWIVAVGGRHTIVFDAETEEVIHGPDLLNRKDHPVLVSVEDKIYALSSFPQVKGKRDFEPWFEVLDLSRARVVDGCLKDCSWEELPSPPCFPCQLAFHEFRRPPVVIVQSYVVVGSYILVSLRSNHHATYAFNTISAKWQKVHDRKSLPFIGRATPHGVAGVYLGESAQDDRWWSLARQDDPAVISAYCIKLRPARPPSNNEKDDNPAMKLSVTEFPVISSETTCSAVTGICFSSLDNGSFCSLNWKSRKCIRRSWDDDILADVVHLPKKAYITLKTYQMEDNSVLQEEETEQTLPVTTHKIAISKQPEQAFKIRTKSGGFIYPAFLTVFNT